MIGAKRMIQLPKKSIVGLLTSSALLSLLSACSVEPTYNRPDVPTPQTFKEASAEQKQASLPKDSAWKNAEPADAEHRGQWWLVFGDPVLNDLERQAAEANQNLKAAAARVQQSRALTQSARAGWFPSLDAGFGPTRERLSPASQLLSDDASGSTQTLWRAQATASYEVDLFGKVDSQVNTALANQAQNEALYRSVLLALQADVAKNYFELREYDNQLRLFRRTVTLRENTLKLVEGRFKEGDISELDLSRARNELSTARADSVGIARLRATSEHSLAVLLGKSPADFDFPDSPIEPIATQVPVGLPSALLERRPDIAAAERAMAAANAQIGLAKSAFFPRLNINATAGFESSSLGNLFDWSTRSFLLGPLTGTALTLPIFDGGRRKADLASARARYDEQVAKYREQVLVAFREVEDNLADLRLLDDQKGNQSAAVAASIRTERLSKTQYEEGQISYLDVIDAQRQVLQTELQLSRLTGTQAIATVNLIRALGGGWDRANTDIAANGP
ncbi:efflux transporter outer membrane subunit [Pseudomonas gingeri]|uniref:efflux transporter outer membrane subunit n=1 Tax=Pseudomonas gingeri TaxID=117681 RepID=UPI0015A3076A|nr:efflux transporter outer membrane subunit [Pseudomonas gingeri]NVZ62732.1 efflux transporter outer membrane subunit [Pseudomonas gingeri]NVZ77243.1 efflux transporter outer membrane subunit [Pseudomonas gingeri]